MAHGMEPTTLDGVDFFDRGINITRRRDTTATSRKYGQSLAILRGIAQQYLGTRADVVTDEEKTALMHMIPQLSDAVERQQFAEVRDNLRELEPFYLAIKEEQIREAKLGPTASRLRAPSG